MSPAERDQMPRNGVDRVPAGVDGIEIKISLAAEDVESGLQAGLSRDAAERRQIWFCEYLQGHRGPTALPLLARGLIVRLRNKPGRRDDVTLKLRARRDASIRSPGATGPRRGSGARGWRATGSATGTSCPRH